MRLRQRLPVIAVTVLVGACGGSSASTAAQNAQLAMGSAPLAHLAAAAPAYDWPEFGLNPQRSNSTDAATGITAANVATLTRHIVALPGTVDSSPIFLHAVTVAGASHDVFIVTTTYGRTLAIDAHRGTILWDFTPPGIKSWQGSYQFTTASPLADPDREFVYATSPDGLVHKLALSDGHEMTGWPVRITLSPQREKLTASLNIVGPYVLASTGGYIGDTPPYVGHVVEIDRASGALAAVFNTLCANRRKLIVPSTCAASDSAILSRSGPVVEPGGKRILIATGNAPYNATTDFGDSVLELDTDGLNLRQVFTPTDQAELNTSDTDLGSSAPALLPDNLVLEGGKDGLLRLLDLKQLDGHSAGPPFRTGGELQVLNGPASAELFSAPTVWHNLVFVANGGGTAAYVVAGRRLHLLWQNSRHGTTPIIAGGLLYIYDMDAGGVYVYRPQTGRLVAELPAGTGHWNSPIVVAGMIALGEGDANDDATSGILDIYS